MGQVYCIAGYYAATKTAPAWRRSEVSRTTDGDQMYNTFSDKGGWLLLPWSREGEVDVVPC